MGVEIENEEVEKEHRRKRVITNVVRNRVFST